MKTLDNISARTFSLIRQSFNTRIVACMLLCSAVLLPATQTLGGFPPDPCDSDPCGSGCDGALHPCCINEGDPCCEAGPPRPWQAAIPAGPFSVVTAWSGNLFTAVPIVGFSGRGPDLAIVLYHDSACVQHVPSNGFGVDLGPGWTISYTGHIAGGPPGNTATVVEDNGTRNVFQLNSGEYIAPPGVYDSLERNALSGQWTLTRKGLSKRIFDDDGKLIRIYDSTSNGLAVYWEAGENMDRIDYVEDDAGRQFEFNYATNTDRLIEIKDPANKATASGWARSARSWDLHYVDSNGLKLTEVRDPVYGSTAPIIFGYNDDGRITAVTDKYLAADRDGKTFTFEYGYLDRVSRFSDPNELGNNPQYFTYGIDISNGDLKTILIDRRGKGWLYRAYPDASFKSITNPLNKTATVERDSNFNVTKYTDASSNVWTYTFDDRGNLTTAIDPLLNVSSNSFDEYDNLVKTLNAENEETRFIYDDPMDPTLLTSIVQPDDGVNGQGVIELVYYTTNGATEGRSKGALAYVVDPNNVITFFEYDLFGHQVSVFEGASLSGLRGRSSTTKPEPLIGGYENGTKVGDDGNSRQSRTGPPFGFCNYDANGNITECGCLLFATSNALVHIPPNPFPSRPEFDSASTQPQGGISLTGTDGGYTPKGQIAKMTNTVDFGTPADRVVTHTFDALGRLLERSLTTEESAGGNREQEFTFNDSTGQSTVVVGGETYTGQVDDAGRLSEVTGPYSTAEYTYYDDDAVKKIAFGNEAYVEYTYLDNGWLEKITHDVGTARDKTLEYFYDEVGRTTAVEERGHLGGYTNYHQYDYDPRGRLTYESRYGTGVFSGYDITYTYDNGGNRKSKRTQIAGQDDTFVTYFYDTDVEIDGASEYGTLNNRLMYYVTSNGAKPLETTWYYYNNDGNVERIISKSNGEDLYRGVRMEYDASGRLWRASGDQWGFNWLPYSTEMPGDWRVMLTKDEYTWHDAQAYAQSVGADLAHAAFDTGLESLIELFAPEDGSEATYWMGGYQITDNSAPFVVCTPGTNCPADSAWCYWAWANESEDIFPTWEYLVWDPGAVCPSGSQCFIGGTLNEGGWLDGQPDDGNCAGAETNTENHMVITLNVNGHATTHGFSDVSSNGTYRAILVRKADPNDLDSDPTYERLWAREFRYDSPRQRYMIRSLDPVTLAPIAGEDIWTEYVGQTPMADYRPPSSGSTDTELGCYLPGASETDIASNGTVYLHSDHLASAWFASDDSASGPLTLSKRAVRTAFGEIVYIEAPVESRYGYAGSWGYEAHDIDSNGAGDGTPDNILNASSALGFPLIHVGARYYNPSTGRFIQRDPIGINGGMNVYEYVGSSPLMHVDPTGLDYCGEGFGMIDGPCGPQPPAYTGVGEGGPPALPPRPRTPRPPAGRKKGKPAIVNSEILWGAGDLAAGWAALVCEKVSIKLYAASRLGTRTGNFLVDNTDVEVHVGQGIHWWSLGHGVIDDVNRRFPKLRVVPCFVAGTLVHTEEGRTPVEMLDMHDRIIGRDSTSGLELEQEIAAIHVNESQEFVRVKFHDEALVSTPEHPYFVIGQGWKSAKDLKRSDQLLARDGSAIEIEDIEFEVTKFNKRVYNLTVNSASVYYVGNIGVLVHNKGP